MLERDFVYLACPYSHDEKQVREARFLQVTKAAARLMNQGHIVYSPITHCHPMEKHGGLPGGWQFWRRIDEVYMRHSKMLVVLPLEGWQKSTGLKAEREMAKELGIPILWLNIETFEIDWEEKHVPQMPKPKPKHARKF